MKFYNKTEFLFFAILFVALSGCASLPQDPIYKELYRVNSKVNSVEYVTDIDNYGVEDYYATTEEFYKRGGDCEEYSLAKYIKLKEMGYSTDKMWLVSGYNRSGGHSVLLVELNDGRRYILDMNYNTPYKPNDNYFKPEYKHNETEILVYKKEDFNSDTKLGNFSEEDTEFLQSSFREI